MTLSPSYNRQNWKAAPAFFTKHTLTIEGEPVMEDWEKQYMWELAAIATENGGRVLEIGFGMGISANYIQEFDIEQHIIIEANHVVAIRAQAFAEKSPRATQVIEGFWDEVIEQIPDESLDGILLDSYPMAKGDTGEPFFPFAWRKLRPGGLFTLFSGEPKSLRLTQMQALLQAGFQEENISHKVVAVNPPADCRYYQHSSIIAPIIKK